jgi:homoserine/homoserine lactone efflux protein
MNPATLAAFCLVAIVAIAIPGPTVLMALANGSRFGTRRAVYGMLGAVTADVVFVTAVALGFGALLRASEVAFSVIKWVGVAYLAYLGIRLLLSKGKLAKLEDDDPRGTRRAVFMRCFIVAVTNPKAYLFTGALLPQFIDPTSPQLVQYLVIGTVFCAIDFTIMFAYAAAGSTVFRLLKQRGALWLDRICGAVLLVLSGALALTRRASA